MSSNEIAIRVQGLSKHYQIYDAPRDRLKQFIMPRIRRLLNKPAKQYFHEFRALDNVSFEIKKGETVGIIGRNGSGKSTLLQLICGTLNPTAGEISINGKVAALLELGAGFNPEFTGRENVFMAASLYGLAHQEIDSRFEQIAKFADIGEFIEQPVKTYSSGMYVRLAFAVIAHVDADILVVDEALSVGDAIFTQKCMRFIREFQKHGTLLFVSHDTSSIINLCQNAIWLNNGKINQIGLSKPVSESYLQYTLQQVYGEDTQLTAITDNSATTNELSDINDKPIIDYESQITVTNNLNSANGWKSGNAEITSVQIEQLDGTQGGIYQGGERIRIIIHAKTYQDMDQPILGFVLRDRLGQDLFGENTLPFTALNPTPVHAGQEFIGQFIFRLPMLPNGQFVMMASVASGDRHSPIQHHLLHDACILNVSSSKVRHGLVGIPFEQVSINVKE